MLSMREFKSTAQAQGLLALCLGKQGGRTFIAERVNGLSGKFGRKFCRFNCLYLVAKSFSKAVYGSFKFPKFLVF
ncbi:hypothetical protein BGP75_13655 [Motiliproteus sp. MSK22-1]|nr:hypothetical protein BGP75_13655 [Motiliproteus sp. MSK22-1]